MNDLDKIREAMGGTSPAQRQAQAASVTVTAGAGGGAAPVPPPPLMVGKWKLKRVAELLHIMISGATGTGKSQIMRRMLKTIRERNEPALILDHGGELLRAFYRPGIDYIANPYDLRSVRWTPFNEVFRDFDFASISQALIQPPSDGDSATWYSRAANTTADALQRLMELSEQDPNYATTEALLYYLCEAPVHGKDNPKSLEWLLGDTPSAALFSPNAVALDSIRPIIADRLSALKALRFRDGDAEAEPFSMAEWVRDPGDSWVFMSYTDASFAAVKPLFSILTSSAIQSGLELPEDENFRLWFVTDELASLGYLPRLEDLLTKGRKHGMISMAGYQVSAQLEKLYTKEGMQTLLSNYHTQIFLKTLDTGSAELASLFMGEEYRKEKGTSQNVNEKGEVTNGTSENTQLRRSLLPNDFMELPKLKGYARLGDEDGIFAIDVPVVNLPQVAVSEDTDPAIFTKRTRVMKKRAPAEIKNT